MRRGDGVSGSLGPRLGHSEQFSAMMLVVADVWRSKADHSMDPYKGELIPRR